MLFECHPASCQSNCRKAVFRHGFHTHRRFCTLGDKQMSRMLIFDMYIKLSVVLRTLCVRDCRTCSLSTWMSNLASFMHTKRLSNDAVFRPFGSDRNAVQTQAEHTSRRPDPDDPETHLWARCRRAQTAPAVALCAPWSIPWCITRVDERNANTSTSESTHAIPPHRTAPHTGLARPERTPTHASWGGGRFVLGQTESETARLTGAM